MQKLHISPRTLQTLRSNGTIPYIKIGHKIYYHRSDISTEYSAPATSCSR